MFSSSVEPITPMGSSIWLPGAVVILSLCVFNILIVPSSYDYGEKGVNQVVDLRAMRPLTFAMDHDFLEPPLRRSTWRAGVVLAHIRRQMPGWRSPAWQRYAECQPNWRDPPGVCKRRFFRRCHLLWQAWIGRDPARNDTHLASPDCRVSGALRTFLQGGQTASGARPATNFWSMEPFESPTGL